MQTIKQEPYQEIREMTGKEANDFVTLLISMNTRGDSQRPHYVHSVSTSSEYIAGEELYRLSKDARNRELGRLFNEGLVTISYREGKKEEKITIDVVGPWDVSKMAIDEIISWKK